MELLRVLHEFLIQVDTSLKKYDKLRDAEARKDAARKRKENLRQTPGALKAKSENTGLRTPNSTSSTSLNANETGIKSNEVPRRKLFRSASKTEEDMRRMQTESKGLSNGERKMRMAMRSIDEESTTSYSQLRRRSETFNLTGPIFGSDPIPNTDPRSALLQAIIKRKASEGKTDKLVDKTSKVTFEDKENQYETSEIKVDPRSALLNAITNTNSDTKNEEQTEVATAKYRSASTPERDPRNALLNAISSRNPDNSIDEENEATTERRAPSTPERDPRRYLFNAIAKRKLAETSEEIEPVLLLQAPDKHIDARRDMLKAITNRNLGQITDQSISNTSQKENLSIHSEENDDDSSVFSTGGESKQSTVVRSSKSLGSGIFPGLEIALLKYDNE